MRNLTIIIGSVFHLLLAMPSSAQPTAQRAPVLVAVQENIVAPAGTKIPRFAVDAAWPQMPETMLWGEVSGVAVDSDDSVWLVHRPDSLTQTDNGLAQSPSIALCCRAAPPVVHFSSDGRFLGGFGNPESAPTIDGVNQWPISLHGISVDSDGTLWFAGIGRGDHVVVNYTRDGKFIRQIGRREQTGGNADDEHLGNPSDVSHIGSRVIVADGYINRRFLGFDESSGKAFGIWGAYGATPTSQTRQGNFDQSQATAGSGPDPESREFGTIIHCAVPTGDGQIYVCDRQNNRAQLFDLGVDGTMTFVRNIVIEGKTGGLGTVTDVALSPDKKYLYVGDMMNGRIWILLRSTHQVLGSFGRIGRQVGQFTWMHSIDTDSQGNLYVTEVGTGRRVQKFVLTGLR
ncbi:NHL repeat-containing protein [Raoultella terrigena]|jgi:hypothetical protein|uniref:hypothetical protein n=1 Tax=Raoultella terrigena TaxID=577 RepID=UPI00197E1A6A|nr:hypothetical protein [Raoultella terrigena]HCD1366842.1 hypothetical protein [Klebsiella variicola subsp. variicola]